MCLWTANPQPLLRCNFIMRGVYLTPGAHTVEFKFSLPLGPLYVSLSAIGVGILLCGFLIFFNPANIRRLNLSCRNHLQFVRHMPSGPRNQFVAREAEFQGFSRSSFS